MEKKQKGEYELYYVRFHQGVPPGVNKEPVSEFSLTNKHAKYVVDFITWTPAGVLFGAQGEVDIVPLANVQYGRIKQS